MNIAEHRLTPSLIYKMYKITFPISRDSNQYGPLLKDTLLLGLHRGCFHDKNKCKSSSQDHLTKSNCHIHERNSVGNCYLECNAKNYTNGGCTNNVNFYFALKGTICLCICDNNIIQILTESYKCNSMCMGSINNGEYGGWNHFSVYESTTVALPNAYFGGFCLTCRPQSHFDNTALYSRDCNSNAAGH